MKLSRYKKNARHMQDAGAAGLPVMKSRSCNVLKLWKLFISQNLTISLSISGRKYILLQVCSGDVWCLKHLTYKWHHLFYWLSKKRLSLQSQTWIEDLCRFPIGLGPDGALWIVSLNLVPDFYNKWKGGWSVSTIEIICRRLYEDTRNICRSKHHTHPRR